MKDIYELLNDVNLDDFQECEVNEIEKKKVKRELKMIISNKSKKGKNKLFKAGIVAAGIFISVGVVFANPTLASKIPVLGEFFEDIYGRQNSDFLTYSEVIDKKVEKDGVSISYNSVVISNDLMVLDFTVQNKNNKITNENITEALLEPRNIKIDGKAVPTGAGASWEIIDDNTIRILKDISISSDGYLPKGNINVQISIEELFGVKNDFGVKFKYDKSEQDKLSVSEKVNERVTLGDFEGIVNNVAASPITASINFTTKAGENYGRIGFIAVNEKGEVLECNGGQIALNLKGDKYNNLINFLSSSNMESVTFIPYSKKNNIFLEETFDKKEVRSVDLSKDKKFVINGTDDIGIKVNDIFIEDGYYVVKYNDLILGKETKNSGIMIGVEMNDTGKTLLNIDDEKASEINDKYKRQGENVAVFKVGEGKNLQIIISYDSDIKFYKDESIKIDLP